MLFSFTFHKVSTRLLDDYQLDWVVIRIQEMVALELKIAILILVIFSIWNGLLIMQNKESP